MVIAVGQIISSAILVPIFINLLFAVPYEIIVWPKVISQAINIPVYAYMCRVLFNYNFIKINKEVNMKLI